MMYCTVLYVHKRVVNFMGDVDTSNLSHGSPPKVPTCVQKQGDSTFAGGCSKNLWAETKIIMYTTLCYPDFGANKFTSTNQDT